MAEVQENYIAGFWKRLFALLIDLLILSGVGFLLGLFFESTFVEIGNLGKLMGFVIALSYFGVMNSQIAKGQTIGKRIVKIQVVDAEGSHINILKSLLRYSVLSIPFFLNGTYISFESDLINLDYFILPIVLGGTLSISYLYLFNRSTRQSLHDLAVGSYVVNSESTVIAIYSIWKPHLAVVAAFYFALAVAPVFLEDTFSELAKSIPIKEMAITQEILSSEPLVKSVSVMDRTSTISSSVHGESTANYTNIHIYLMANDVANPVLAERYAQIVIDSYVEAINKDSINITLSYGFDIGIWSQWYSHTHVFNPAELRAIKASSI